MHLVERFALLSLTVDGLHELALACRLYHKVRARQRAGEDDLDFFELARILLAADEA